MELCVAICRTHDASALGRHPPRDPRGHVRSASNFTTIPAVSVGLGQGVNANGADALAVPYPWRSCPEESPCQ